MREPACRGRFFYPGSSMSKRAFTTQKMPTSGDPPSRSLCSLDCSLRRWISSRYSRRRYALWSPESGSDLRLICFALVPQLPDRLAVKWSIATENAPPQLGKML